MSDKRPLWLAVFAFGIAILLGIGTYALGHHIAESRVIVTAIMPLTLAALFAFVAWWHGLLVRRENVEQEDKNRLSREYDREDLFGDADATLNLAADAHKHFDRYFLTSLTILTGIFLLVRVIFYWAGWMEAEIQDRNALQAAGLSFFMLIFCLLAGTFYNGASREPGCRFLRPVGNWFLLAAFIYALAFFAMLAERFNIGQWDSGVARIILVLIGILAIEMIFNFIIEFYRPRILGEAERPLYESRILGVITEPGGIAKNVAHALDYQFGFKVSETWFYSFLERAVVPFVVLLLFTLYLLDCFILIDYNQMGIRETFGAPAAKPLQPGLHLKLPVPIQRIYTFPVGDVTALSVGYEAYAPGERPEPNPEVPEEQMDSTGGRVLLWNKHHFKDETRFLVPAQRDDSEADESDSRSVPVSFLSANIFIHYKIDPDNLYAFAYNYTNTPDALRQIMWRETVAFLARQDFIALLSSNYQNAQRELDERIRQAVDDADPELGIIVLNVGIGGVHPPVEVAGDFQAVVGADIERHTRTLAAEGQSARTLAMARAQRVSSITEAEAYRNTKSMLASSEAQRFESQLLAYRASGPVFMLRSYLDMLESISSRSRKFVVSAPNSQHIQIFDFTEKVRPDLQNVDLNAPDN